MYCHGGKMNKGLYKNSGDSIIFWYKTWKNSSENSGASIDFKHSDCWTWEDWYDEDRRYLVGAACLAQW